SLGQTNAVRLEVAPFPLALFSNRSSSGKLTTRCHAPRRHPSPSGSLGVFHRLPQPHHVHSTFTEKSQQATIGTCPKALPIPRQIPKRMALPPSPPALNP